MKAKFFLVFSFCVWLIFPNILAGQTKDNKETNELEIRSVKDYPNLGTAISKISNLKIYNPKNVFHFEEILVLDIALLTPENDYYFFPKDLDNVNIIIKNNRGEKIWIDPILVVDRFAKFEKYKNGLLRTTERLLIGCENESLKKFEKEFKLVDENEPKNIFNRNLFWSIPSGCIDIKNSDEIEVYAEFSNNLVVVTKDSGQVKTGVGKIKSNALRIKIKQDL
ncbi:hypothetical protein BH20ACI4_BH20ACI4_31460 [soil metagenome]